MQLFVCNVSVITELQINVLVKQDTFLTWVIMMSVKNAHTSVQNVQKLEQNVQAVEEIENITMIIILVYVK